MKRFLSDRRGNIAIVAALGIPVFAGGLALGTEAGFWLVQKSQLAATTDAISVSAAKLREKNMSDAQIEAILKATMVANGYPADTAVDVTFPGGTTTRVDTSFPAQKYFSGAVFKDQVNISAKAVIQTSGDPLCLLALSTSVTNAFQMQGNGSATLNGCIAASNSSISIGGSSDITAECLYAAGTVSGSAIHTDCPIQMTNKPIIADPFASIVRPLSVGCGQLPALAKKGTTTILPGCYNGNTDLKGDVVFSPGVYILEDTDLKINANANITGAGVTIFLKGSSTLAFNGNATIDLSAPTSALSPYGGMLFVGDNAGLTGSRDHKLNGNASTSLTGNVYFPKDSITFTGNSGPGTGCLRLIANTVQMTGSSLFKSDCTGKLGPKDPVTAANMRIIE